MTTVLKVASTLHAILRVLNELALCLLSIGFGIALMFQAKEINRPYLNAIALVLVFAGMFIFASLFWESPEEDR